MAAEGFTEAYPAVGSALLPCQNGSSLATSGGLRRYDWCDKRSLGPVLIDYECLLGLAEGGQASPVLGRANEETGGRAAAACDVGVVGLAAGASDVDCGGGGLRGLLGQGGKGRATRWADEDSRVRLY